MRELSLFSGGGGGLLATHGLLGWETVGYVEYNDYCQKIIAQRIRDGLLDNAQIFGDIRAFIKEGFAAAYQGMVDVITAGFPCQPFSVAGKRAGENDERNMWPETIECIRLVRPRFALLENVPGLLATEYFGIVLGDLAESGYDCRWVTLGGGATNSCTDGKRVWICVTQTNGAMLESVDFSQTQFINQEESFRRQFTRAVCAMLSQDDYSGVKRNLDAVARGMDRLKAIGNGWNPRVAAAAWRMLTESES